MSPHPNAKGLATHVIIDNESNVDDVFLPALGVDGHSGVQEESDKKSRLIKKAGFLVIGLTACIVIAIAVVKSKDSTSTAANTSNSFGCGGSGKISSFCDLDNSGVVLPPEDLPLICSPSYVQFESGLAKCRESCAPSACCMEESDANCFDENKEACELYSVCVYFEFDFKEEVNDRDRNKDIIITSTASEDINELCSRDSTSSVDGRILCDEECQPALCCISNGIYNCAEANKEVCSEYSVCWDNGSDVKLNVVDDYLEEVCALTNIQKSDGRDDCEKICGSRSCCFSSEGDNCSYRYPDWCAAFAPCRYLNMRT
mmetsp:Transcript_6197/g.8972  ORF Transcript_6197/g.8972 Transcript_6197/m.8972 type:complete len:316 (-) Transcript_6197:41-988(-)|eukprot:CAMPEP_0195527288 /NCGR_PEP_ID=MMETSP0794_2-20130614/28851_1 /TAXON_ID=515487 /ORGANISM="Stephanopyxis turris, Strain CCMP 815" /LENGTH=315 /DNA_ID=CAMNT_0040658169 /DNA_START=80 /DNA_END=1027 /DNA_ORIENTATION=-